MKYYKVNKNIDWIGEGEELKGVEWSVLNENNKMKMEMYVMVKIEMINEMKRL